MKIIGRMSAKGNMYYQTAVNHEGSDTEWIPVFVKKSLEGKFEFISKEKKVDKKGVVYECIEIPDKNVFKATTETGEPKFVITK